MSAAVNSRAAVSFGSPQDVEVLVDGTWVPGAMLGWRHDDTGACEVWVRPRADAPEVVEGVGTWVGLTAVRLPERHLALAPAADSGACGAAVPPPAAVPALAAVPARAATPATTAMPDVAGAPVAEGSVVGSQRPRPARRHGADVTAEQPAVGAAGAGRHRAPSGSGPGRHRAVTSEMPAVTPGARPGAAVEVGAAVELGGAVEVAEVTEVVAPAAGLAVVPGEEHDLLTRPIRLGDLVPNPRGGRPAVRPRA